MPPSQNRDSSANALIDLVDGHRVTAVIYVAVSLGIADLLFDAEASGRRTSSEHCWPKAVSTCVG
jgi:hypothetical protein